MNNIPIDPAARTRVRVATLVHQTLGAPRSLFLSISLFHCRERIFHTRLCTQYVQLSYCARAAPNFEGIARLNGTAR